MSDQGGVCPRCATPFEPGQGYCLECGMRLDADAASPGQETTPAARPPRPEPHVDLVRARRPRGRRGRRGRGDRASSDNGGATTLTVTTSVAPVDDGRPAGDRHRSAAASAGHHGRRDDGRDRPHRPRGHGDATTAKKPTLIVWPGKTAYTVVLASLPSPGGHGQALARANQALAKGLPQVGVLDSGDFPSLNPGYYVVFSGVYKTLLQAETGARNARFEGFGSAYPRQIKR